MIICCLADGAGSSQGGPYSTEIVKIAFLYRLDQDGCLNKLFDPEQKLLRLEQYYQFMIDDDYYISKQSLFKHLLNGQ